MKIPMSLLMMFVSTACTQNPPALKSDKPLQYSFQTPSRTLLPEKQAVQLGVPDRDTVNRDSRTYYYSANGNICRRLPNRTTTVCYINGNWYEAAAIMTRMKTNHNPTPATRK